MDYFANFYECCELCPNRCRVDRTRGQVGRCGQTSRTMVAWAGLHKGEEPPVSGKNGSGMIFFCGCPLHCQYCQNYQISHKNAAGVPVSDDELALLMLRLQEMGAASINLVTGTHFIPSIAYAVEKARNDGLKLPVVWNSSGFEAVEALKIIDPFIDLYLVDAKTLDRKVARDFCGLESYAQAIVPVMKFLRRRHPETVLEEGNLKGSLVRHLVFPGCLDSTVDFIHWFNDNFAQSCKLSLMVQFVPPRENPGFEKMTQAEYDRLMDVLEGTGIDGFTQELDENEILWIPDFTRDQPFPENFAKPLPYFLDLKKTRL